MNCGRPDEIDEEIIRILWRDGRITMQELGRRVHLTGQAVKNRIERLEDLGIIQRYTVNVNCPVYGYKIHALIKVELSASQPQGFEDFINSGQYKIIHCYRVTGKPSYVVDAYFMSEDRGGEVRRMQHRHSAAHRRPLLALGLEKFKRTARKG